VLSLLENVPEVRQAYTLRSVSVDSPTGPVQVAASSNPGVVGERTYLFLKVDENQLAEELRQGKVLLSEPLYNRLGYTRDTEAITLYTATGPAAFPITGVYYDYSSPQGTLLISQEIYRQHWNDETITAVALLLEDGVDPDSYSTEIQARLSGIQALNVRPNLALRAEVLEVFDRTFAITTALQLLATTVAFVGVLSALLSLELERGRELGILRSIGLTARQIWGLILMETGLMGGAAGLLALPTGYVLAVILIYIINLRSFGWTLQMQVIANPFVWALLISVAAALLAGIYPAWRMSRTTEADAMRME
jgi:putative ABC transport system permease protein